MVDPKHYTYRVIWSEEDGELVGVCAEFPSLSHLAETQGAALEGITGLVTDIVADMQAAGESPPAPIADRESSGRFQVRIAPELHRRLAIRAAEADVSLNRIVSDQLAKPYGRAGRPHRVTHCRRSVADTFPEARNLLFRAARSRG